MKKLLLSLAAIVALFATSCVTDATDTLVRGDQCTVTFTVAPDAFGTRAAINDGTKATQLSYAVYKSNWEFLFEGEATMSGLSATIPVQLVKNNTYNFVFWAQSPEATYYTVDLDAVGGPLVSVDYAGAQANDDNRDAFFGRLENYLVTGPISATVTLTRPFAQVNFATNDTVLAEKAGFNVANATTTVTIEAFSTLNLATGTVDGLKTVTFAATANPTETLTVKGSDVEWDWLAMNYILWGADEASLSKCEMTIATNNMTSITVEVPAAPARRNWRTNLVGSLLIEQGNIEIIVDQKFEGEYVDGIFVSNGVYHINNANGLSALAAEVEKDNNGLQGKTIILDGDIDLAATRATANFTPIGTEQKPFLGTFDGKGYTIKNLVLAPDESANWYVGFFGYAKNATIKNVTFENVNVLVGGDDTNEGGHIAAVVGALEGTSTIENVTVQGNVYIEADVTANNASRVAAVVGGNGYGNVTVKNVHVQAAEGSYVKANNCVGALAGQLNGVASFENCTANIDVTGTKFFAGGIIGLTATEATFVNCHSTGDVAITAGRSGKAHDHYRVGGIAGGWDDNVYFPLVLTNCSYTGKVSGTNADGSVAEVFDYLGYVGRGYTINGRDGSKVIIDGIEFVQTAAGEYNVTNADGVEVVVAESTADVQAALAEGENVLLAGDVTVAKSEAGSNGYGAAGISQLKGGVIDGNGNDLYANIWGTWDSAINTTGGTIKNLNVTGAMRGIFVSHNSTYSAKVVLENVIIDGTIYTLSCDQGTNSGLEATNCTFNGWTSYAATLGETKFVGCSFGEGQGYAFCRPFAATEFVNCAFAAGYELDAQAAVSFENCTLGGVALTAENLSTLVVGGIANATVK